MQNVHHTNNIVISIANKLKTLLYGFVSLFAFAAFSQSHNEPPVQLNNHSCEGVLYTAGRWNETSRPGGRNTQPIYSCNNARDNCGQFRRAMDYSQTFCSFHTGGLTQAIFNPAQHVYYHGPSTLIQPQLQTSYDLPTEGVDFSCQICAPNESVQFETQGHQHTDQFFTNDDIFMHWWRRTPQPTYAYSGYQLSVHKRPISSGQPFELVAKLPISNQTFQQIALSQQLELETCHQFEITLSVQDGQGIWADSTHHFNIFDMLQCPPKAQNQPSDPFPVP